MKWRDRISILSRKRRQQSDPAQVGSDVSSELGHTTGWSSHSSHHHHVPGSDTPSSSTSPPNVASTLAQVRPVIGPDHKSYYILLRGTGDSFTCIQPAKKMLDSLDEVMKNVMNSVEVDKMAENRVAIEQQQNHYQHHHHKQQIHNQHQQQQHTITTCTARGGKGSANSRGSNACSSSTSSNLSDMSTQRSPSTAISTNAPRMKIITRGSGELGILGGKSLKHPTTATVSDRSTDDDPVHSMDLLNFPLHIKTSSLSKQPDRAYSSPSSVVQTEKTTQESLTHINGVAGGGDSRQIVNLPTVTKITNPEHFVKLVDLPSHTKSVSTSNSKQHEKKSVPLLTKIVACSQPTLKFPIMPVRRKNAITTRKQSQKLYELLSRQPKHGQAATTRPYPSEPSERKQSETPRWKKGSVQSSVCQGSSVVLQRLNEEKQQQHHSLDQSIVLSSDKTLSLLQTHLNGHQRQQVQQQQQSLETGVVLSSDKTLPELQNRLNGQKLQQQQNMEPRIAVSCDREPTEMYDTSDSAMDSVILNRLLQNLGDDSSEQSVVDHNTTKITSSSTRSLIYSTTVQTNNNNNNNITGNHKSVGANSRHSSSSSNGSTKHTTTVNNKVPESCLVVSSVQYEDEDDEPESLAMTQVNSESIPDSCTLYETTTSSTEVSHSNEITHGQNDARQSSPEMFATPEFPDVLKVHGRDRLLSRMELETTESPAEPVTEIQLLAREGTVLTEEQITEQIKSMIESEQLIVQENHHLVAMRYDSGERSVAFLEVFMMVLVCFELAADNMMYSRSVVESYENI